MKDIDGRIREWLMGCALVVGIVIIVAGFAFAVSLAIAPAIIGTNLTEPKPIKFSVPAWYDLRIYELKDRRVLVFIPLRPGTTIEDDYTVIADIEAQAEARGLTVLVIPCGMTSLDAQQPLCITYWSAVERFSEKGRTQ